VNEQSRRSWRLRAAVLALLGLLLMWQVTTKSLVAYLAEVAPRTAIRLRAGDPATLLNLASEDLRFHQAAKAQPDGGAAVLKVPFAASGPSPVANPSAATGERIRAWAELALRNDPLNARAFRILGQLAENGGDDERGSRMMLAAARRSLRESLAIYSLMRRSYKREDFASALYYADVLLRTRQQIMTILAPALARIAEHKAGSGEIKKLLAANPPWREEFFSKLSGGISDARTPLELLLSVKDTSAPPTPAELQDYLNFLISHKLYEVAYYAWLQFLPAGQLGNVGFLFNGGFGAIPSGLPFDWAIAPGSGVTADIVARPGDEDKRALFIEFGYGRVEFRPVMQLIVLTPGTYKFKGSYKGEIIGRRGLQWRVTCADEPVAPIGGSAMAIGLAPAWKPFDFEFTVPANDCRAQYVSLALDARSASEQMVSGSIWYSELRLERTRHSQASR
jgi:hypothetical protein